MAQKIEECITSNGHGEMEVLMKKSHDVWNFDPICGEIVGRVYRREGGIFAYKMSLTVEETRVTSAANCSTTRKIDFQQLEDHQLIGKLKLRFD